MTEHANVSYAAQIAPGLAITGMATVAAAIFIGNQPEAERGDGWQTFAIVGGFAAVVVLAFAKRFLHPEETRGTAPVFLLVVLGIAGSALLRNSSAELAGAVMGALAGGFAGFSLGAVVYSVRRSLSERRRARDYEGPDVGGGRGPGSTSNAP